MEKWRVANRPQSARAQGSVNALTRSSGENGECETNLRHTAQEIEDEQTYLPIRLEPITGELRKHAPGVSHFVGLYTLASWGLPLGPHCATNG